MNSQQLIIGNIESELNKREALFTRDSIYGSTGVIATLDSGLFAKRRLHYSFQPNYVTFSIPNTPTVVASHWYGQRRSPGVAPWVADSPQELVSMVVDYLMGAGS